MNILNALARLRDDIKTWVTNNINVLNTKLDNKLDSSALPGAIESKQDTLVSGTNIKTINGESILGSGDIVIEGGSVDTDNFIVKNTDEDEQTINCPLNVARSITVFPDDGENYVAVTPNGFEYFFGNAENVLNLPEGVNEETIATQEWVLNQNYLISDDLVLYAKLTDIPSTSEFLPIKEPNAYESLTIKSEDSWTNEYGTFPNNEVCFLADGTIRFMNYNGKGQDAWYWFAEDEISHDGGGTIATREWVQANAPSVDTSNFVTKNDTTLKLTDGDSYAGGHLTLSGINGTLVYADYPNAAPCDTIKLDLGAADSGNAYAVNFKFPKQAMAGDYTLATQEWVTANAPSVDTSDFISKTTTSEQTIKSSFRVHNSEEGSGYRSVTISPTSLSWTEYVTGNTVNIVEDMSASTFGTSCTLVLPVENGTLATREWFEAQKASLISEIIAALPVYNGEVANE